MILAISGAPGAGKSVLAAELSALLDTRPASFGDYVRHLALERGVDATRRDLLQDLGDREVRADPVAFVDAFMRWAGSDLAAAVVLDGLRHLEVRDAIVARAADAGAPFVHVHVRASALVRAGRRAGTDGEAMAVIDSHPVERAAHGELDERADLVVSGSADVRESASGVLAALGRGASAAAKPRPPTEAGSARA